MAERTSPTNMAIALLSELAAYDFGYLSVGRLIQCMENTLSTMEKLERYRGHFYNWYNTKTLRPLHPLYVSTVDSGNLSGCMIVLKEGLQEMANSPILPQNWRKGFEDTAAILLQETQTAMEEHAASAEAAPLQAIMKSVNELTGGVRTTPQNVDAAHQTLSQCVSVLAELERTVVASEAVMFWLAALRRQCEDLRDELRYCAPWVIESETGVRPDTEPMVGFESLSVGTYEALNAMPRLQELASLGSRLPELLEPCAAPHGAVSSRAERLKTQMEIASERAAERVEALRTLAARCAELSEMDVDFLYDRGRNLLAIGFNLDSHRLDPGYYDLLASESRLCSFIGVAQGILPAEHWFSMGRQLAMGDGRPVLVSWSGSLFEYLMPLLIMPSFKGTLLDETCQGAVKSHIHYGKQQGIPWGFSESCYNQLDTHMTYQYRTFGVPSLGLKRGLVEDLVVAPYASLMALMVAPREAVRNIEHLSQNGLVGKFGFYEAVDYTAKRMEPGEPFSVVRSYMAHHTGMSLLGLDYLLNDRPMQRRFMKDPRMRASILLLQERIPLARGFVRSGAAGAEGAGHSRLRETREPAMRSFTTANSPVPEVHLLSNGRYHAVVTNAGSGFSRWQNLILTRWREDVTQDNRGIFFYLRDVDSGAVWSTTFQPMCGDLDRYEVTYIQGIAEFRAVKRQIEVHTQIAVSPEDDIEMRRMVITNLTNRRRTLEITSFAEVVLLDARTEMAHPVFHNLFVRPETLTEKAAILFTRRPKSDDEHWPWLFHTLVVRDGRVEAPPSFQTDRSAFIGRGRSLRNPEALDEAGPLFGRDEVVLDPAAAIRYRIRIGPGQSTTVNAILGVGRNREEAHLLIDRYQDYRITERVFELAWTHSQVLMHHIHAEEADAQNFARLAGSVLYASPQRRGKPSLIARNRKNQSGLWSYGISGDLPIVLLRLADQANLELARKAIQAHTYWRRKGLQVDMLILVEAYAGYRQNLLDAVIGLVQAGTEAKVLDQPGGIFVRNIDQVPEDDRILFQAVARIVLSDRFGTLTEQIERQVLSEAEVAPLKTVREPKEPLPSEMDLPHRELMFFNGLGGFTPDGREYVVQLNPGTWTPAPWVNVLANQRLGSVVTESGGAYTWYQNAHMFRLTPWHNDPVCDLSGEAYYVRDEETGRFWSPTPKPARGHTPYVCRHGLGYSAFEHTQDEVCTEGLTYVAIDVPLKFVVITVRNLANRTRRFSVTGYCEWVLGETRDQNAAHVVTRLDPQTGALFAGNAFNIDFSQCVAAFYCSHADRSLTADRMEFIGRNGSLETPAAMEREKLSNRVGAAMDPCAAIQAFLTIPPKQREQVVFVLGAAESEQEVRKFLRQYGGIGGARQALEGVWQFWKHQLGGVYVETPDPAVNFMANHWLPYQVLTARFWGRSGYYQSGGAYGFRDQLQDSLAFLYECPWFTRQHLLHAASRQFLEGDVQHWWHPPAGRGVRTRISDDALWLPYVACRYVGTTGDMGVLDEPAPYLEGRPLVEGEESYFDRPLTSEKTGTLYEHCVLAIRSRLRFGRNGLPLIGCGDWNDGMNRVGHGGQGESVWLAFFLYHVLEEFGGLASRRNDREFADTCSAVAAELRQSIEAKAWDGKWYLRAFFDDGSALGSSKNPECQISSLPQSWAVLSGAADIERARSGLNAVLCRLLDPELRLIRLFAPPFDSAPWNPGYIKGYAPGVRENGGQYTHAAVWVAMAFAVLKEPEKAWELFGIINPIGHGDTQERIKRYKVEPYVLAADLYTAKGQEGRGGWTWYTGSAGWMYQLLVEKLLGLKVEVDTLSFAPLFPPAWSEFTLHYRYRNTFYHIRICKVGPETWKTRRVLVENIEQPDMKIHLIDDGRERAVRIEVG